MNSTSSILQKAIQTILENTDGLCFISLNDLAKVRNREVRLKALALLKYRQHHSGAGHLLGYKSTKPNRTTVRL